MPAATNISLFMENCSSLVSIDAITVGVLTNANRAFNGCSVLVDVPLFDTSAVTLADQMFLNCSKLKALPPFVWTANIAFGSFLGSVTLLTDEYNKLLIAIDTNTLSNGTLDGGVSEHSDGGSTARANLIVKIWSITDGGPGSLNGFAVRNTDNRVVLNTNGDQVIT